MSATTINSFPSLHSFSSSPRGWFMAIIVLLHAGFFWALSSGVSMRDIVGDPPPLVLRELPRTPPPATKKLEPDIKLERVYVPARPPLPLSGLEEDETAIKDVTDQLQPARVSDDASGSAPAPIFKEPQVDRNRGLSQPVYPPAEIRANHTGTVVLAIHVLEDGRVGSVRIEQSSGYPRLDDAAVRAARQWRMRPGTSDGVPTAMWKRIPVTFRLNEPVKM